MQAFIIVFFGAGFGGAMRHCVNVLATRFLGLGFPYGTVIVNVIGSLVMGMLIDYFALRGEASQHWRLFLTTGILGGFTTFSAFSLDVALHYERGETALAACYACGSVLLAIGALFAGMWLMKQFPA